MKWLHYWIFGLAACLAAPASAQILPDRTGSAATNTTLRGDCASSCTVEGGIRAQDNLFHSFRAFNVSNGAIVRFVDPGVSNILVRVTGNSASLVRGRLGVAGDANLFLLNPNGVVFGSNASLDIGGSFITSTADAIRFGDRGSFSATLPESPSLLTVRPSAFLFGRGEAGTIENNSTAANSVGLQVGLQVKPGQSLILLGGEVLLRGNIISPGSQVNLGGLAGAGEVQFEQGRLKFPEAVPRADVISRSGRVEVGSGSLGVTARSLSLYAASLSSSSADQNSAGSIAIDAQDRVDLIGSIISSQADGSGSAGRISIETGNQITAQQSTISSATFGSGSAGRVDISTQTLRLSDRSLLSAKTSGSGAAGQLFIIAPDAVEISDFSTISTSGSFSSTSLGNAGSITLRTDELALTQGGSLITDIDGTGTVQGSGGNIDLTARLIRLSNEARISAQTAATDGGNVTLQGADLVLLDRHSSISASAGARQVVGSGGGNGGNITLSAQFLVADPLSDSDITANAFEGAGGRVDFTGQQIFGIQARNRDTPRSDITVSSTFGNPGTIRINRLEVDPIRGLIELPDRLEDASSLIAQTCRSSSNPSRFMLTGRGGLPSSPSDRRSHDMMLLDWATIASTESASTVVPAASPIVEAQGWRVTASGKVALVAPVERSLRSSSAFDCSTSSP